MSSKFALLLLKTNQINNMATTTTTTLADKPDRIIRNELAQMFYNAAVYNSGDPTTVDLNKIQKDTDTLFKYVTTGNIV